MKKLLLIEDSPTTRAIVKVYLTGHEFEFAEATDGQTGLESVERFQPDVVVLDLNMPGLNGFDVCRTLRAKPQFKQLPIILVTGSKDPAVRVEARKVGVTHFMTKPIDGAALARAVLAFVE